MQITGIALKDYGGSGMKVTYNRYRKFSATHATKIGGNEEYDLPLPANIRAEIKGLKYFLLYLMKMWDEKWDKYLTEDCGALKTESQLEAMDDYDEVEYLEASGIFRSARFEGYKLEKGGFILWGDIEIIEGKVVKIKLPVIVEDDDFTLYHDCLELIEKINEMIVQYFAKPELSLEDVKETLKLMAGDQMKDEIDEMDESESLSQMASKLEAKGAIVIIEEGSALEKEIEKDSPGSAQIVSSKTLKEGKIEDHEEVSSQTADSSSEENKEDNQDPQQDADAFDSVKNSDQDPEPQEDSGSDSGSIEDF